MWGDRLANPVSSRRARRGQSALPVVVALGLFAIVLGTAFVTMNSSGERPQQPAVVTTAVSERVPSSPRTSIPQAVATSPAQVELVAETPTNVRKAAEQPAAVRTTAPLSVRETVEAHLAVGEFGPALSLAQSATTAEEKSDLLNLVADAQMSAGEFDSALFAIRRMPLQEQRVEAQRNRAARWSLAGGGSQADFDSLIELIQSETSGPWEEIDGTGGTISEYATGVRVDPNGLLYRLTTEDQTARLQQLGIRARQAELNEDLAKASDLRLVSLTRLERAVAKQIAAGQPVVETMKHLAGLSQIQYVFVYPEANEIIIGGPAEGWRYTAEGQPVGVESGRPTMQLDDFVTVFRNFAAGGDQYFSCLIVPRQEGLRNLEQYVAESNARGPLNAGAAVRNWVSQLQNRLGMQDVVINGIPLDSRVSRVIVEADYRMKLIGVDKLDGGKNIPSYFDLLPQTNEAASVATVGLRWWMEMKYDAVLHSPDRNVFEIQGSSVMCLSEDERITPNGERIHTGQSSPTNRLFAENFTNHYAELAARDLVFADLQNIFDLALVSALIEHEQLDERAAWQGGVFARNGAYATARHNAPREVMSVANHRVYNGKDVTVQVAGGVKVDGMKVVRNPQVVKEVARLASLAEKGQAPELPEGRWWWDAVK